MYIYIYIYILCVLYEYAKYHMFYAQKRCNDKGTGESVPHAVLSVELGAARLRLPCTYA